MRYRRKLVILYLAFCFGLGAVWLRAGQLLVVDGATWREEARDMRRRWEKLEAPRGEITDRTGAVLAEDIPVHQLSFVGWDWLHRARVRCTACGSVHFHHVEKRRRTDCECVRAARRSVDGFAGAAVAGATLEPLPFGDLAPLEKALGVPPGELDKRARKRLQEIDEIVDAYVAEEAQRGVDEFLLQDKRELRREDLLRRPYVVESPVSDEVVHLVELDEVGRYRGFRIQAALRRHYPQGDFAPQLLGHASVVRDKEEFEQLSERFPGQITPTTRVGRAGLERAYNGLLSGYPGHQVLELDSDGWFTRVVDKAPPERGLEVRLSISLDASRVAEQAIERHGSREGYYPKGRPSGAFVAIDVVTGEILMWAEMPRFDPNTDLGKLYQPAFTQAVADQDERTWAPRGDLPPGVDMSAWRAFVAQPVSVGLSRVAQVPVEPGSTFKVIVGLGMLSSGEPLPIGTYFCRRGAAGTPGCHGCGSVDLVGAIARSCNRYFAWGLGEYETWGTYRHYVADFASRLGIGHRPGDEVPGWSRGLWLHDWIDFPVERVGAVASELLERRGIKPPKIVVGSARNVPSTVGGDPRVLGRTLADVAQQIHRETGTRQVNVRVTRELVEGQYVDLRFEVHALSGADALQRLPLRYDKAPYAALPYTLRKAVRRVTALGGQFGVEGELARGGHIWFTARFDRKIGRTSTDDKKVIRHDDRRNVAIGQGPVLATPLQMARAIAAIANGGIVVTPHALMSVDGGAPRWAQHDLRLSPSHLKPIHDGMRLAVRAGTADGADWSGVNARVYGKTGTAQVGGTWRPWRPRGDEDEAWHHWFVGFAEGGGANPIAFACVLHARTEAAAGQTAVPAVAEILSYWYGR